MAVEMIGGPRLCEPLLATGLGRFTGAASRHAERESQPRRSRRGHQAGEASLATRCGVYSD